MTVATFQGVVENGQIRLPAAVRLPEKARVFVVVPDMQTVPFGSIVSPRLVHPEQATDFRKAVVEEATDAGV